MCRRQDTQRDVMKPSEAVSVKPSEAVSVNALLPILQSSSFKPATCSQFMA